MTCPQCNGERNLTNPADPSVGCPEEVVTCDLCDGTGELQDRSALMPYIAEIADLKCQLRAMTKDRDDYRRIVAEQVRKVRDLQAECRDLRTELRMQVEASQGKVRDDVGFLNLADASKGGL